MSPSGASHDRLRVNRLFALLLPGLIAFALPSAVMANDNGFTLSGQVLRPPEEGGRIVLKRNHVLARRMTTLQTIELDEDGFFEIRFEDQPGIFEVDFYGLKKVPLALDCGQSVHIELSMDDLQSEPAVTGSADTDLLLAYERFRRESFQRLVIPARREMRNLQQQEAPDEKLLAELTAKEIDSYDRHQDELLEFARKNMGHSIAIYAAALRWDAEQDLKVMAEIGKQFQGAHPDLEISSKLNETVRGFQRVALGATASEIQLPDSSGQMQRLSSRRGKVVLLDFWASWCPPCRVENPKYAQLFEKYRDRGFSIYSVSLDTNRVPWLKASDRDGIAWTNVSDLTGYNSPAAKDYSVNALPVNFLLDAEGRIIAKNLRGEKLRLKIASLLGE